VEGSRRAGLDRASLTRGLGGVGGAARSRDGHYRKTGTSWSGTFFQVGKGDRAVWHHSA